MLNEILMIEREISALKCKHDFIQLSILALEFEYNEELADMLREYGYTITTQNYYPDLQCKEEKAKDSKHHQETRKNFYQTGKKEEFTKLILMRY
jgi:hypothetical protein